MTLKTQILNELEHVQPYTLTNQQLSWRLHANQPSVRRVTRELARGGKIHVGYNFSNGEYGYKFGGRPGQTDSINAL